MLCNGNTMSDRRQCGHVIIPVLNSFVVQFHQTIDYRKAGLINLNKNTSYRPIRWFILLANWRVYILNCFHFLVDALEQTLETIIRIIITICRTIIMQYYLYIFYVQKYPMKCLFYWMTVPFRTGFDYATSEWLFF